MISVVIPAHNEEESIENVLNNLNRVFSDAQVKYELIVVDDGSTDSTGQAALRAGAKVRTHKVCQGYGQAIRTGVIAAQGSVIGLIDGDGSYRPEDLHQLLEFVDAYDMVVGARQGVFYQGSKVKSVCRLLLILLCEFVAGNRIPDINSGLRIFRKEHVVQFAGQLSYGFSFTTSLTMNMLLNGYFVGYVPIQYDKRVGKSKVRYFRDTLRTLQIVIEAFARYNPLKLFLLIGVIVIFSTMFSLLFAAAHMGSLVTWLILWLSLLTGVLVCGLGVLSIQGVRRSDRARNLSRKNE